MCSILWQGAAEGLELLQFVRILPVFSWVHILSLFLELFLVFPLQDTSVTEAMFWSIYKALSWDIGILKAPTTKQNKKLHLLGFCSGQQKGQA